MNTTSHKETHGALLKPIFLRATEVFRVYGLKRGFLYNLVRSGVLTSVQIRGRSGMRGIRLFRPEDIEKAIQSLSKESNS